MTTEDDFNAALDACPEDWQTRLVFADWLDEHGDERAEGYRALGALKLCPHQLGSVWWYNPLYYSGDKYRPEAAMLPTDWYMLMARDWLTRHEGSGGTEYCVWFDTRREAGDAAARAFAKLSKKRRRALLQPPVSA